MGMDRRAALRLLSGATSGLLAGCTAQGTEGATSGTPAIGSATISAGPRPTAAAGGTTGPTPTAVEAPAPERIPYGTAESQFGDLYRPAGVSLPGVVVIIHGGFWMSDYNLSLGSDLAQDLASHGHTVWNLEYRRLGPRGGGWPDTFADIASGIDVLADMGVDLTSVVLVGHSAGGQLAVWAAARVSLPQASPGADPRVRVTGVVSQAGVLDLTAADAAELGGPVVAELMGGHAEEFGERYALADPILLLPLGVPVRALHGPDDDVVPPSQSADYVAAAVAAGDDAVLVPTPGGHFEHIETTSAAWALAVDAVDELSAR